MNKKQYVKLLATTLVAGFSTLASVAMAQQAPEAQTDVSAMMQQAPDAADASVRLEARLQPVIGVDASAQARLDSEVGTANDRLGIWYSLAVLLHSS